MRWLSTPSLCTVTLAIGGVSLLGPSAGAQALGGSVAGGSLEIGVLAQDIERDLVDDFGSSSPSGWGRRALFVNVAPTGRVRLSVGGAVWYAGASDRFPTRRYRRTTVGFSATAFPWSRGSSQIGIAIGAHYLLDFDESSDHYHKRSNRVFGAVVLTRGFRIARQEASGWIAPAYVRDELYQYPFGGSSEKFASKRNFAVVLGGEILVARHLRPYWQGIFANHWATELGLAFRF